MNAWGGLLRESIEAFKEKLSEKKLEKSEIEEYGHLIRELHFPGLIAFLGGVGSKAPLDGRQVIRSAAVAASKSSELRDRGVTAEEVEKILTAVFVNHVPPNELLQDATLRRLILEWGVSELGKQVGGISPEEASRIVNLVSTGRFFEDLETSTAALVYTVHDIPLDLAEDVPRSGWRFLRILRAAGKDLKDSPFEAVSVLKDLADGKLDNSPVVMVNTMKALYGLATLRSTANMIATLIGPNDETMQWAIVIYARAHGIPITRADLTTLSNSVFNTKNPDLGSTLTGALEKLSEHYKPGDLQRNLAGMCN